MAEYIEREAVMQKFADHVERSNNSDFAPVPTWNQAVQIVEDFPAADVVPVRHGRWVLTTQPLGWRDEDCAECSECGEDFVLDEWDIDDVKDVMRYCPNCGALMDKDGDGDV